MSVDEAHNKAMKIERLQSKVVYFKNTTERTSSNTIIQQGSTSDERPLARKATEDPLANQATTTAPNAKGKENPYTKPEVGKYYRCGEPGHKSNECPKRRQVNMADYEREDEVEIRTEPEDSLQRKIWRVGHLRGTTVVMQPKVPDTT